MPAASWLVPTLLAILPALPPLSADRLEQVRTATDLRYGIDEPALYPLLRDALAWPAGDEAGAAVPDYRALREDPAAHRGELALIEGELVMAPRPVEGLARPGPWTGRLQQWIVLPDQKRDEVIALYVVVPEGVDLPAPRVGRRVRVPARFYKLWADEEHQPPRSYLAFVTSAAAIAPDAGGRAELPPTAMIVAVLALVAVFFFVMRRFSRVRDSAGRPEPVRDRAAAARRAAEAEARTGPPLPEDPAAALDELRRRSE